ncbi:MAG: type II toxin-antitoxin system RelB/DinJ family antitoxin [Candidatus Peregrinibacteria bacterium]
MTTTLHIRMSAKLKKDAKKIAERNGVDLPTVVRIFFTHMVDKGTVPITWLTENSMTLKAEQDLLAIAHDTKNFSKAMGPQDALRYLRAL